MFLERAFIFVFERAFNSLLNARLFCCVERAFMFVCLNARFVVERAFIWLLNARFLFERAFFLLNAHLRFTYSHVSGCLRGSFSSCPHTSGTCFSGVFSSCPEAFAHFRGLSVLC